MTTFETRLSGFSSLLLGFFRIIAGVLFALHGSQKLFGIPVAAPIPIETFSWPLWWAGLVELVTGVLHLLKDIATTTDITFLCVTHEMQFARDVSDRVMMFDGGKIVEDGPPEKIFTAPENDRTREFLQAVLDRA